MPDHLVVQQSDRSLALRVTPLVLAAAMLLGANGLAMTVIAVRGRLEGLSDTWIGLLGSAYYAGMMVGVLLTPWLIKRVGHIRVFTAFASICAIAMLALLLMQPGLEWVLARFVTGIAFCGTAMVVESWLNALASNADRGRVLSVYRIVDLAAVTGGQFLLPLYGAGGYENSCAYRAAVLRRPGSGRPGAGGQSACADDASAEFSFDLADFSRRDGRLPHYRADQWRLPIRRPALCRRCGVGN